MIPKKIHYCWFGTQPMSQTILKCIESWQQHLPDFELVLWNETNSDLSHPFAKQALKDQKWAFLSDYVRLNVLSDQGGVYLDTDMLVLKNFSTFLDRKCFVGLESERYVSCGVIGTEANHPYIVNCLRHYDTIDVSKSVNYKDLIIPKIFTSVYKSMYKTEILEAIEYEDLLILDVNYFYAYPNPDPKIRKQDDDYLKHITETSYAVHLWERSWKGYNEFQLIHQRRYLKAFFKMITNGNQKKMKPKKYYRKLLSTIKTSIFG
ncbi:glycosyltransferase [Psychroserpens ponticola]|uniref:Glycosyltransferase n=1 Tax=Psychroserpens ponticola TaxID=2932268 RepID=A0ABY7RZG8_9FLAO|nr:glycosyltransferase [Psychroserpens ponticola]WCO02529.1 glycosyltransferase [Psychroserpens ponticola]